MQPAKQPGNLGCPATAKDMKPKRYRSDAEIKRSSYKNAG